jgi:hypothetical protein
MSPSVQNRDGTPNREQAKCSERVTLGLSLAGRRDAGFLSDDRDVNNRSLWEFGFNFRFSFDFAILLPAWRLSGI